MTPSEDIPIPRQSDGNYECDPQRFEYYEEYPCINGTYYPDQCYPTGTTNCSSIIGFSPYYDIGLLQKFLSGLLFCICIHCL